MPRYVASLTSSTLHSELTWCVILQDWVNDQSLPVDLIPPTTTVAPTTSAVKKATLSAALRAELMQKTIVQPSDPEMAARPCPICKETFKGEFSDEEEEWLWANAVEENGIVSESPLLALQRSHRTPG